MTLQQFIEMRIRELDSIMQDQVERYGGGAFGGKTYRSAKEIKEENERLLAVLRGEIPTGGRIQ